MEKSPLCPTRVRKMTGRFACIEHRFLRDGFWSSLGQHERLLSVFLVLVADRNGLSYYSFDKLCALLQLSFDDDLVARNALIHKDLIAFDGHLFQVLSLPPNRCSSLPARSPARSTWYKPTQPPSVKSSATLWEQPMMDKRTIFAIPRWAHGGLSVRKIAKTLGMSRQTTSTYLDDPHPQRPLLTRPSQLDPLKDAIRRLLEIDPKVSAVVLRQRLAEQGFTGGITIVRDDLSSVRPASTQKHPFIRFASAPGRQCQIDWGHCDALVYGNPTRTLYCLGVVECHSRMLSLEFPHSQRQETLHRCLLNALRFFQGTPKEVVHDNMLTAVLERHGPLVRFHEQLLEFLRPFHIVPIACNVAQPQEKGKVEQGAIHYIRHNCWPLRTCTNLQDLQAQAHQWRDQVANVRVHHPTGQRPIDRCDSTAMQPVPALLPDCRDTALAKVHTAFSVHFDGNTSTVPPWLIGTSSTVKADHQHVMCYFKDKAVATHPRCWQRKQRIELPQHREAARTHRQRHWHSEEVAAFLSLGAAAKGYLERLATTNQPLKKHVKRLLALKDDSGAQALLDAIQRASLPQASGAHSIENIL